MPRLIPPYHRTLQLMNELFDEMGSNELTFEESKKIIDRWISQPELEADDWVSEWTDVCSVEIDRWDTR